MVKQPVDIIIGINVFAHNDSYESMFSTIEGLLADNGYAHIEVAYAADTVLSANFDTIYHEHMSFHSYYPLEFFFKKLDMRIYDYKFSKFKGVSIKFYIYHKKCKIK